MSLQDIVGAIRNSLDFRLFEVGGTAVTGASVLTFVLVILASMWISRVVQRVVQRALVRGGFTKEDTLATTRRLLHYAVLVVGFGVALQTIGISLTTVFAAGAVAAVAIGFALQNILQNFVSGVILLAERSITETDVLEVEGTVVRIRRMGARAAVAVTREDEELIIPNSILVQSTVKNLTLSDEVYRVRARVGVSYGSDMAAVETVLEAAARSVKERAPSREPRIHLVDFGDSSVVWEVSIWAVDPWAAPATRSELNKAILVGAQGCGHRHRVSAARRPPRSARTDRHPVGVQRSGLAAPDGAIADRPRCRPRGRAERRPARPWAFGRAEKPDAAAPAPIDPLVGGRLVGRSRSADAERRDRLLLAHLARTALASPGLGRRETRGRVAPCAPGSSSS